MFALARPDMAEKLNMDEGRRVIQGIMQQYRESGRDEAAQEALAPSNVDGASTRCHEAQMESPEGKAWMEQQRKDEKAWDRVGGFEGSRKKQKDNYKKMIGPPFDLPRN